jgi:hypothetical protein
MHVDLAIDLLILQYRDGTGPGAGAGTGPSRPAVGSSLSHTIQRSDRDAHINQANKRRQASERRAARPRI